MAIRTEAQIVEYYLKQIREVTGLMYVLKSGDRALDNFEAVDEGDHGKRMNLLGVKCEWIFEGQNIIKRLPRSNRRRIKKAVENALRKAEKKYAE